MYQCCLKRGHGHEKRRKEKEITACHDTKDQSSNENERGHASRSNSRIHAVVRPRLERHLLHLVERAYA
ncbi:hypothetical protein AB1N83_004643 [Pleurotus pulmonarius]